ncbi:hypothetical protein NXS19_011609 [Fusarium pseudograminearum]|nr:hypothetical protein NXS19_011609 [Fusarium pseudograminearum]
MLNYTGCFGSHPGSLAVLENSENDPCEGQRQGSIIESHFTPTSLVVKSLDRCRTVRLLCLQLLGSPVPGRSRICDAAGFITHNSVESGWRASHDEIWLTTPGHQTPGGAEQSIHVNVQYCTLFA